MKTLRLHLLFAIGIAFASAAMATPVGALNVANCSGGGVTITSTTITWSPVGTLAGTGCADTGLGTFVNFSGGTLGPGVAGNIKNLVLAGGSIDQFMTFPAVSPVLDFVLSSIGPGSASTNCAGLGVGASCSIAAGSPYILTNLGNGVTSIGLLVAGQVLDSTGSGFWSGSFTSQVSLSAATIQSTIVGGGSIASTYSGQFTITAVPEPATILVVAGGLLALGLKRFRR